MYLNGSDIKNAILQSQHTNHNYLYPAKQEIKVSYWK